MLLIFNLNVLNCLNPIYLSRERLRDSCLGSPMWVDYRSGNRFRTAPQLITSLLQPLKPVTGRTGSSRKHQCEDVLHRFFLRGHHSIEGQSETFR